MNLLITNPQEIQAYTIMRSLRPYARKVVITVGGDSVNDTGFEGMPPHSRFVDARHAVPHFASDWLAGRSGSENSPDEEAYLQRIEEICRLEQIDVIFPSLDPEVHVFARNKERLLRQGVVTVVPDADVIRIPMDKGLTMQAAARAGFPHPRTWFPQSAGDIDRILAESEPPWLIKPRFTAHGLNMVLVESADALADSFAAVGANHRSPIVQEFIPGTQRQNYYVMVDRQGSILSLFTPKSTRVNDWGGYRVSTKSAISASSAPYLDELRALLADLRLWGGYTIQTKVDPRDGRPKLLEINARLGQHVWWRTGLGVNEPLMFLQLARGEQPQGDFTFRDGVMLLDPYHDIFKLYALFVGSCFRLADDAISFMRGVPREARPADVAGFRATLRVSAKDYLNRRPKVFCPEVGSLLSDPSPCVRSFWFKFRSLTAGYLARISDFFTRRLRRVHDNL